MRLAIDGTLILFFGGDIFLRSSLYRHLQQSREFQIIGFVRMTECVLISSLSNFIHQRVIEKNKQKIYNKHQNAVDMQYYQAVTCV